jgi:uncharacterized hydrophobic protein (TIGR00271 family)
MMHVRVVSPPEVAAQLRPLLISDAGVMNLVVTEASAHHPDGDVIQFDVIQGRANDVLAWLRALGIDQQGSIIVEPVTTSISAVARQVEHAQSRFDAFSPVWEEVDARIRADGRFPPSWYVLLVIAGLIAAVGILTNSQILIVGAMVVGPEYGAIVALAYGQNKRDTILVRRSMKALTVGFSLAVVAALALGLIIRAAGLEPKTFQLGIRPVSHLINTPDWYSVIVAVLAGVVGVISLTEVRTSTLIGVFISVTTIPAAADIGVSLAFASNREALGSLEQLLLNIFLLAIVALLGIPAQRRIWNRVTRTPDIPLAG